MQLNLTTSSLVYKVMENYSPLSYQVMDKLFQLKSNTSGTEASEAYCSALYPHFIGNAFFILTIFNHSLFGELDEMEKTKIQKVVQDCALEFFPFFSKVLKKPTGKIAFEEYLCESTPTTPTAMGPSSLGPIRFNFMNLIEVAGHDLAKSTYAVSLMRLLKTLFSQAAKFPDDISLIRLCSGLSSALAENPNRTEILTEWFNRILFNRLIENTGNYYIDETSGGNIYLFYKFICHVIKDTSRMDEVVLASMADAVLANAKILINDTSIQSCNGFLTFCGLFTALVHLMSTTGNTDESVQMSAQPGGHFKLINEVVLWLTKCKDYLSAREVITKLETSPSCGR